MTNLYEAFLQRGPDAGGLSFWSGQAGVGTGRQNVLNQFATCGPFRELAGTLYREAFWLVSDHLGTPRMIVGKSGTLASVKRHDYLPFGEELSAPMSGRTTTQGYTGDSVRQHFTGYEADGETGLNFAQARYQSTLQGRFTSVDPLGRSANVGDPQSFNRYSYVENNPVNLIDPTGMSLQDIGIVQTTDESYARTLQGSSDSVFKQGVNKDAHARSVANLGAGIAAALAASLGQTVESWGSNVTASAEVDGMDPDSIQAEGNSPDCAFSVLFKTGTHYEGRPDLPNGPSTIENPDGTESFGLGFTVTGTVIGGIGRIGTDSNPQNPKGTWILEQWTAAYIEQNGKPTKFEGKTTWLDISRHINYRATGNNFTYYDHPGGKSWGTDRYNNFSVKVSNGLQTCKAEFHFIQRQRGPGYEMHWGKGTLK